MKKDLTGIQQSTDSNGYKHKKDEDKSKKKKDDQQQANLAKQDISAKDLVIRSNELEQQLQEARKESDRLVDEIEQRKDRFQKREQEYRKVIQELQAELHSKVVTSVDVQKGLDTAKDLHTEIIDNINNIQLKTSKILVDQERDIIRFFNNKINEIKKQFEDERIKKGKKDQDNIERENQLISELEWIKNIAQKIDSENHNLMKKYIDLKAQYQTQENDREMLLKELIMKKKKNAILQSQIEQYEKLLKEVSMEADNKEDQQSLDQSKSSKILEKSTKRKEAGSILSSTSKEQSQIMKNSTYNNKFSKVNQTDDKQQQLTDYIENNKKRSESALKNLYSTLKKEQRRVGELKNLYVKELESKTELERIIRKIVEELREQINPIQDNHKINQKKVEEQEQYYREKLVERLLSNEKILTLVYDKTFYPDMKNADLNLSGEVVEQDKDTLEFYEKEIENM